MISNHNIYRFDKVKIIHEDDLLDHMDADIIEIPSGIEKIEEGAFAHGSGRIMIHMEDNPYYSCKDDYLIEKKTGRLIAYTGTDGEIKMPLSVKIIGKWAFYECHAEKVIFAKEIREIHKDAFTTCLLKEAVFPFWNAHVFFPERDIRLRQHMLEGFGLNGMFDFQRYDEDLAAGFIEPERIREITARIKWPHALTETMKERFWSVLEANFVGVLEELGRIDDEEVLIWLCEVKLINEENMDNALEVLHSLKNLSAYIFLSKYRNSRPEYRDFDFSL